MGLLKIILWIFVIIVVLYAFYMAYNDVSKYIPQENKKVEKFKEPELKICLFYANWCGHCKSYLQANTFMNTYDQLKTQNKFDNVVFVQFDFDKNKELGEKYNISSFPTIIAISANDNIVSEFAGDRSNSAELIKFTSDSLAKI
jgi:thiol-disulfide isomerase/thioredoxin